MQLDRIMRAARPFAAAYMQDRLANTPIASLDMSHQGDVDRAAMFLAGYAWARIGALLNMPAMADDEVDDALRQFPNLSRRIGEIASPPPTNAHPRRPEHHSELMFDSAVRRGLRARP